MGVLQAGFLLLGIGPLYASQKVKYLFQKSLFKTRFNRTGSVFALPILSVAMEFASDCDCDLRLFRSKATVAAEFPYDLASVMEGC